MTYDSPFWGIEEEVIPEVAYLKEEGLVTPEGWERKKMILEICWSMPRIEPRSPGWNAIVLTTTLSRHYILLEGLYFNKMYYMIKAPISPNLHYPRLRWSILAIKAYILL
jgi:hypothetical protein